MHINICFRKRRFKRVIMLVPDSEEAKAIRHFQSLPDNLVDINPVRDKCPFFPNS